MTETKQKEKPKVTNVKNGKVEIRKDANIAELVFQYPEVVEIFAAFGLHCASCFASQFDTVEQGAKLHGMIDEEIDEMIDEANRVINGEEDYGSE